MPTSTDVTARVREHFHEKAFSFDHLYDEEHFIQRLLRPGLFRRREFALDAVRSRQDPTVLDVGCGSGRIGEAILDAGASRYVGIDLSPAMLELAEERLRPFGSRVELVHGDFLALPLDGPFDVIVALGLFDYVAEPPGFARRMRELCSGEVVASFPRWNWLKGPIRKLRYEVVNNCPIFDYTARELLFVFGAAGFERVDVLQRGRGGFLLRASVGGTRPPPDEPSARAGVEPSRRATETAAPS